MVAVSAILQSSHWNSNQALVKSLDSWPIYIYVSWKQHISLFHLRFPYNEGNTSNWSLYPCQTQIVYGQGQSKVWATGQVWVTVRACVDIALDIYFPHWRFGYIIW